GGGDNVTVHNLAGTDVKHVGVDLGDPTSAARGGDGISSNIIVEGTNRSDVIAVTGSALRGVELTGLAATIDLTEVDPADKLTVNARGGNDIVQALTLDANVILLAVDGGSGNDVLVGSAGDDTL